MSFRVLADATFEGDLKRWCAANDCTIPDLSKQGGELSATLTKGSPSALHLHLHLSPTPSSPHSVAIVLFSNDLDMAMGVMGLTREELIDEVDEVAGVAAFAELAKKSNNTLFI